MNDLDLLNQAKAITKSDAETGRRVGLSRQNINNVRTGRRTLTPAQAGALAELCGLPDAGEAMERLMALEATEAGRAYWRRRFGGMSSGINVLDGDACHYRTL